MVASPEIRVAINSDPDIVIARQKGRARAVELGFSSGDATLIATAISELARNIVAYAKKGMITLQVVNGSNRQGIAVTASDDPPRIPHIRQAFRYASSPSRSPGLSLP